MGRPRKYFPELLVGKTFTFLTVLSALPIVKARHVKVTCLCKCGKTVGVLVEKLLSGRAKSCGCYRFVRPETWQCRVCGRVLPFTGEHFHKKKGRIHGLSWDCKECTCAQSRKYNARLRLEVLNHYGNGDPRCVCCGERQVEFLCLDHKNNDGKADRKEWGLGARFYLMLKRNGYPDHLQILCFNCNFAKSVYGVCPHEKARATASAVDTTR